MKLPLGLRLTLPLTLTLTLNLPLTTVGLWVGHELLVVPEIFLDSLRPHFTYDFRIFPQHRKQVVCGGGGHKQEMW